jgi:NADH dehydrogenase
MPQTIAVAGAGGFIGSHITRELIARGFAVTALVRNREKARETLPHGERLRLVQGDATDDSAVSSLVSGAAACINCIGLLRESAGQTFRKLHVEAARKLTAGCAAGGVHRFVQISALGVNADAKAAYQKTKWEGEQIVRRSGLEWTILRPGLVHGLGSDFVTTATGWVRGNTQPWFFLPYFARGVVSSDVPLASIRREPADVMPIAVEDVAWAAAECLSNAESIGEIINLVGPERLSWPEMLETIRDGVPHARADLLPRGVPAEAAAIQARVAKHLGIGGLLPFDEGMAIMGGQDSTASPEKARLLLNLAPRPFRESFRTYCAKL